MCQITITIVRIALVVLVGAFLYFALLKLTEWIRNKKLRLSKNKKRKQEVSAVMIIIIYLTAITILITISIFAMKYRIRGAR